MLIVPGHSSGGGKSRRIREYPKREKKSRLFDTARRKFKVHRLIESRACANNLPGKLKCEARPDHTFCDS